MNSSSKRTLNEVLAASLKKSRDNKDAGNEAGHKTNISDRDMDEVKNPQTVRGEEGDVDDVENGESVGERRSKDCGMQSQLINNEETKEDGTFSSRTQENTNIKSEEESVPEETNSEDQTARKEDQHVRSHKLHGLRNQGATCYLNSVLQVLSMTTEIHKRLGPDSQHMDLELINIFEELRKETCGTENITKSLNITNVHQQRDAAECLDMILQKVSPQASEVFRGELKCSTKCSEGHSIIEETNPFLTLPLSLTDAHDSNYSVERGFEKIFQEKSFSGDNMVYCNVCMKKTDASRNLVKRNKSIMKTKATSECEMVKFPKILTLLLKRFDSDNNTMSHVKSDRCVDVPCALNIDNKTYELYGMVNHMVSLGGHYTATIWSKEDQTWYEFDDTHVNKVKEQPFAESQTYRSKAVYLLMYREGNKLVEPNSDDLKDKVEEIKADEAGHKNIANRDTEDKENPEMKHCRQDEGWTQKSVSVKQEHTNSKSEEESAVDDKQRLKETAV